MFPSNRTDYQKPLKASGFFFFGNYSPIGQTIFILNFTQLKHLIMETWNVSPEGLIKTFTFKDFEAAMQFMQAAVPIINQLDHHPTWTNTYARIDVLLITHDAGNQITDKDWALASALDALYQNL